MPNLKYVGLFLIIIIFAILFIPKIIDRVSTNTMVESNRSMNKNMKLIEGQYGTRGDFGIASFTIDPSNDTPTVLKKYAEDYEVFSQNWHFLTGEKNAIYSLANTGFNIFASVNPQVEGGFEHQGYFALIDKKGFIRSRTDQFGNPIVYYMGLDKENVEVQEVDMLIEDIKKLLNE